MNTPTNSQPGPFTATLLAALLALPAAADTCHYGHAGGTHGTTVSIAPGDDIFAVVTIDNKLAFRAHRFCDLTIYGVTVHIEYDAGAGSLPDWFRVTVPEGFVAVPPEVLIDDGDSGQVLIVLDGGVGS